MGLNMENFNGSSENSRRLLQVQESKLVLLYNSLQM